MNLVLTLRACDDREVVAFASAAEGVIFAERVFGELVGHQDAAEVGVAGTRDAEHVEGLAFHPVGSLPCWLSLGHFGP